MGVRGPVSRPELPGLSQKRPLGRGFLWPGEGAQGLAEVGAAGRQQPRVRGPGQASSQQAGSSRGGTSAVLSQLSHWPSKPVS